MMIHYNKHFTFLLCCLLSVFSSCVPDETDFLSPVPVATEATSVSYTSFMANWDASLGVDTYILEVATDIDFNSKLPSFPIEIEGTAKSIEGLEDGQTYYFRVRGIFNGSNTEYSNIITVNTLNYNSLFPQNLRLIQNGVTEFSVEWDKVDEAEGYIINLAFDENFTSPVPNYFQLDVGNQNNITFTDLLPEQLYACKVQSYQTGSGNVDLVYSDDSEILVNTTFKVPAPTPYAASNITPLTFTAHWSSIPGADRYLIDVAEDENFTNILDGYNQKAVIDTFEVLTDLDYRKNYYYRVKARVKEKLSDYSEVMEVASAVTASCKINKIYYQSTPTTFTYDDLNRIDTLNAVSRYGDTKTYAFTYTDDTDLIREANARDFWGSLTDNVTFFYNANNDIDSLLIKDLSNGRTYEVKYTYNSENLLTDYDVYILFNGDPTRYFFARHDYTHNEKGEIITIEGREYVYSLGRYRDINWEMRYDDKLNPFVLLPQSIASLVPFTVNTDGHTDFIPFFSTNNFTYIDFGSSTEIIAYESNEKDFAYKQLGFFEITYEFIGCD